MGAYTQTSMTLQEMENYLFDMYAQAGAGVVKKAKDFMADFYKKDMIKQEQVKNGELDAEVYKEWRKNKLLYNMHWTKLISAINAEMANVNQTALEYINGEVPNIFAVHYNDVVEQINDSHVSGYSFEMVDADTVNNLINEQGIILPPKKNLDKQKDKLWNAKQVNAQLLQGILQGDSIPAIAERMMTVTNSNAKAAVRTARTLCTAAENSGRQSGMNRAEESGIKFKKLWISTSDERTRASHIELNGKTVLNGEKFETINDEKLEFPGDWHAAGFEVYNCRCTMGSIILGFEKKSNVKIDDMSQQYQGKKITETKNALKVADPAFAKALHQILNAEGKPSEVWNAYLNGTLNPLTTAKVNGILTQYELNSPVKKLKGISDQMQELENHTFAGIWKDAVNPSDYSLKKDKISAKKAYFNTEIDAMQLHYSSLTPDQIMKLEQFKQYMLDIDEFEKLGKEYEKLHDEYQELHKKMTPKVKKATKTMQNAAQFSADQYTDEAKAKAYRFTDKRSADKHHRAYLDSIWDNLDESEKYAVWEYTRNSNPMNRSLSGYHESWSRSDFIGLSNTLWSYEDKYRTLPSEFSKFGKGGRPTYHAAITNLTKAIDKSSLPESVYLVRGSDKGGFAGLLEGGLLSFDEASKLLNKSESEINSALSGQSFTFHSFMSTGVAEGTGFSGNVKYRIYAPAGTKGIYAEPQSYFGSTTGMRAKLYKTGQGYSNVGNEAEIILQRGTQYRITNVKKTHSGLEVEMEIVEQPDYFKFGDENTFDQGKTRHDK